MDRVAYYGDIDTGDPQVVTRLIQDWLKTEKLSIQVGHVGVEIVYEDEGFYLFCHEAASRPGRAPWYLLEGHMDRTLEAAKAQLRELLLLCRAHDLECSLEYVQVNEDGDEVSEQFTVK